MPNLKIRKIKYRKKDSDIEKEYEVLVLHEDNEYLEGLVYSYMSEIEKEKLLKDLISNELIDDKYSSIKTKDQNHMKFYRRFLKSGILNDKE